MTPHGIAIEKEAFSSKEPDRGFTVKAFYLQAPNDGNALVEIYRDGQPYRRFLFPAYKIWNIAAHFSDIVDGEIEGNFSGYDLAGWTGFNDCGDSGMTPHGIAYSAAALVGAGWLGWMWELAGRIT